jgi:hypothetical protein
MYTPYDAPREVIGIVSPRSPGRDRSAAHEPQYPPGARRARTGARPTRHVGGICAHRDRADDKLIGPDRFDFMSDDDPGRRPVSARGRMRRWPVGPGLDQTEGRGTARRPDGRPVAGGGRRSTCAARRVSSTGWPATLAAAVRSQLRHGASDSSRNSRAASGASALYDQENTVRTSAPSMSSNASRPCRWRSSVAIEARLKLGLTMARAATREIANGNRPQRSRCSLAPAIR